MRQKMIVSIYIHPELLEKIDKERENFSRSSYIENILMYAFKDSDDAQ